MIPANMFAFLLSFLLVRKNPKFNHRFKLFDLIYILEPYQIKEFQKSSKTNKTDHIKKQQQKAYINSVQFSPHFLFKARDK